MRTRTQVVKTVTGFFGAIAIAISLLALSGCDNFMSQNSDFKSTLQKEVFVANAQKVDVTVQADSGSTTTSPSGVTQFKVGVPTTLYLTTLDEDYGFIRWVAYNKNNTAAELTGVVTFGNSAATETSATLGSYVTDVLIRPLCEKRPTINDFIPKTSSAAPVVRNYPVKIYFSKPIQKTSFAFSTDAAGASVYRTNNLFKNITILGKSSSVEATDDYVPYEQYFTDPVLSDNGKILTLKVNPANVIPPKKNISVTISKMIADTSSLGMAKDYTFMYTVSGETDVNPPTIFGSKGGNDSAVSFSTTDAGAHRLTNAASVYLSISAEDDIGDVGRVYITETHPYSQFGSASGDPLSNETYYEYTATGIFDTSVDKSLQHPTMVFPVPLKTASDGVIDLAIQATDSNGNKTAAADAVHYLVIRDTTPPSTDNGSRISYSGASSNGYFNGTTYPTITFSDASNAIADYGSGGSASVPRTRSATVYWDFSIGGDASFNSDWAVTTSAKSLAIPATVAESASIPVYVRFRDDIGNVSAPVAFATIKKDVTPPSGTVAIQDTDDGVADDIINNTTFKYAVSASDNLSGVAKFYTSESATAPTAATSGWQTFAPGAVSSVGVSSGDGTKTIHTWYMDGAENISAAASDSAMLDTTNPVVNEFWVNTSGGSTPSSGVAYAKSMPLYFGFYATDLGSGVKSLVYSDNYGSSIEIPIPSSTYTWSGAQGSGNYIVDGLQRVEQGGGKILVFGTLTVPTAKKGDHTFTLKVKDNAGNWSGEQPSNKKAVYDTKAPDVSANFSGSFPASGVYAAPYYNSGSAIFTNSLTGHTVSLTVTDNPEASETVSGAYTYDVTGSVATVKTGAVLPGAAVETTAARSDTSGVTFSAGDGTKTVTVTGHDYAGNTASASASMVYDSTPPGFGLSIQNAASSPSMEYGNGMSVNSNNSFTSNTMLLRFGYSSIAWNTFWYRIGSNNEASSGVPSGAVHPVKLYKISPSEVAAAVSAGTLSLSGEIYSGQGFTGGTELSSFATTITAPTTTGYPITLPIDATLGRPFSGYYAIGVQMKDNLGNTSAEQRMGFYYDQTKPEVASVIPYEDAAGTVPMQQFVGSDYWTNKSAAYLFAQATDRRSGYDPEGSGIATIRVYATLGANPSTDPTNRTYTLGSTSVDTSGAAIVYDPNNLTDKFLLRNYESASSIQQAFTGISSDLRAFVCFTDAAGNATTYGTDAAPVFVKRDAAGPSIGSVSLTNVTRGATAGVWYMTTTGSASYKAQLGLKATDVSTGTFIVGANAWALSSGLTSGAAQSAVPGIGIDAKSWQTCTDGSLVTDTTVIRSLDILPEGTAYYLYLHARDKLGNTSTSNATITERFQMDNTAPTVSDVTVKSSATSSTLCSQATPVIITVHASDTGSGIGQLVLTNADMAISAATTTISDGSTSYACTVTQNSPDASHTTITFAPGTGGGNPGGDKYLVIPATLNGTSGNKSVSVYAIDVVGNSSVATPTSLATPFIFDETPPSVSAAPNVNGGTTGIPSGKTVCMTLSINEQHSGIRTIVFSGTAFVGSATLVGSKVYKGGSVIVSDGSDGKSPGTAYVSGGTEITAFSVSGGNTISFADSALSSTRGAPVVINIEGITLDSSLSNATLTATSTDDAGNTALVSSVTGLSRDDIKPILSTFGIQSSNGSSTAGYSISNTITANLTFAEETSGINVISFEGVDASGASVYVGGTALPGTSFTAATSSITMTAGNNITGGTTNTTDHLTATATQTMTITGLVLDNTQGTRTVKIRLRDGSGNQSGSDLTPATIILDTVKPTVGATFTSSFGTNYTSDGARYYTAASVGTMNYSIAASDVTTAIASMYFSGSSSGSITDTDGVALTGTGVVVFTSPGTSGNTNTYNIYAKDQAGNISDPCTRYIVYESTAPTAPTAVPSGTGAYNASGSTWYFRGDGTSVTITLSGSAQATTTSESGFKEYGYRKSTDGSITWLGAGVTSVPLTATNTSTKYYFFARDNIDNATATLETSALTIQSDSTLPVISAISGPTVTVSPTAGYYYDSGSGKWYTNAASFAVTLTCGDSAATSAAAGFAATGAFSIDGAAQNSTSFAIDLSSASEGEHTYSFTCVDRCGNESLPVTLTIVKDTTGPAAPTVSFDAMGLYNKPATYSYYSASTPTVSLTPAASLDPDSGAVGGSGFLESGWSINAAAVAWSPASTNITLGAAKTYTFYARDKVGNVSAASTTYTFVQDTTVPIVNLSSILQITAGKCIYPGSLNTFFYFDARATWAQSDDDSGLKDYAVTTISDPTNAGITWTAVTGATDSSDLPAVTGTASAVYLHVRDQVGKVKTVNLATAYNNKYGTPATYSQWLQDTTPPEASAMTFTVAESNVFSSPNYYYNATTNGVGLTFAPVAGSATDSGSGVATYSLNSDGSGSFATSKVLAGSEAGSTSDFYAIDGVGNVSTNKTSVTVVQDKTAPTVGVTGFTSAANHMFYPDGSNTLYYYGGTIDFTQADNAGGVGLYGYAITANATPPASGWTTVTTTPVSAATLPAVTGTASEIYLHVKDLVGQVTTKALSTEYNNLYGTVGYTKWLQDTIPPDASGMTFTVTESNVFASSKYYYNATTNGTGLTFAPAAGSATDTGGSGVTAYSLNGDGSGSFAASTKLAGSESGSSYDFYAIDGVGNVTLVAKKKSVTVVQDKTAPTVGVTGFTPGSGYSFYPDGSTTIFYNSGTIAFTQVDNAGGVGLYGYAITASSTPPTLVGDWTTVTTSPVSAAALPAVTGTASEIYLHVKDLVGKVTTVPLSTEYNTLKSTVGYTMWLQDTTAPSAANVTATGTVGNFYYKATGAAAAILYYKATGSCTVGTLSGGTDTGGSGGITFSETSTGTYTSSLTPASAYTVAVAATHSYWIKDAVGNKQMVTITDTEDADPPAFGSVVLDSGHKLLTCTVSDPAGGAGLQSCTLTGSDMSATGTFATQTNGSYTWSPYNVSTGAITLTDSSLYLPDFYGTGTNLNFYLQLVATDNVGRTTTRVIKVHYDTTSGNQTAAKQGSDQSSSIMLLGGANLPRTRGTVTVATPIEHAATISGSGLIDWEPQAETAMNVNRFRIAEANKKLASSGSSSGLVNLQPLHNVKNDVIEVKFTGSAGADTVSARHAAILARLRGENGSVQGGSEQNVPGSEKNAEKRPEIQNDIKQDESLGAVGVYSSQDAGRLFSILEPLAAAYLESKGITL